MGWKIAVIDPDLDTRRRLSRMLLGLPGVGAIDTMASASALRRRVRDGAPNAVVFGISVDWSALREDWDAIRSMVPSLSGVLLRRREERCAERTLESESRLLVLRIQAGGESGEVANEHEAQMLAAELVKLLGPPFPLRAAREADWQCADVDGDEAEVLGAHEFEYPGFGLETRRRERRKNPAHPVRAVVIGASTGGPNALAQIVAALPAHLPVPIFIAQHMPVGFTRMLAERLTSHSLLPVSECVASEEVVAGRGWLAAGGTHMVLRRLAANSVIVRPNSSAPVHSCRPAVDPLFASAAAVYGAGTLAVVLTGMGQDGAAGAEMIHRAGGRILAQDKPSSVVWGMPGAVVARGIADAVLPLEEMAGEIALRVLGAAEVLQPGALAGTLRPFSNLGVGRRGGVADREGRCCDP